MNKLIVKNLRTRLTILYGTLLALALTLYAGGTSAYFLYNLRHQLDFSLDRDIETVEGLLSVTSAGQIQLSSHEGEAHRGEKPEEGYLLEIWARGGALLYRSKQLDGQPLRLPLQANGRLQLESPRSHRLPSGLRVRQVMHVHRMGDESVIVLLAVSEERMWREFIEMVSVLAIGLPITVLLVGLTGYVVAGRALRPVDAMARRAAKISAERLNERLTIENPNDELGHLGMAFNETLSRLEGSFEQLRRFTGDASHELRTPLTAIRSVGEVALQKSGDANYFRDIIGSMLEEANRLTRLVDSLLTMSRADAGQIPLVRTRIGALELAKESATLLEVLAEEKDQKIVVTGDSDLAVWGDRMILRQALVNLIDNAVKYSPLHGSIHVRVNVSDQDALIEVQDSGAGIPEEHRDKVFERFYRIDKARNRAEGGTGLGLSIAQWAISAHGGEIQLDDNPGPGCTFRIRMPIQADYLDQLIQRTKP